MNKNINVCNNCGKTGHQFNQCKLPIISYGIVLFRNVNTSNEFLMIRRKDSFGFIDFIRGKYLLHNISQIQDIINEMSLFEKEKLIYNNFDKLWKELWGEISNGQFKHEELTSQKKYELLKNGIVLNNNEKICLQDLINNSTTNWIETEWEFPKGRRNYKEKDLECALREFEEETGISREAISIVENILPFEEIFIGTNYKSYKHKYFLATINENFYELNLENFQKTEVSKLEWKNFDECINSIRPYNLEKKKLITNINKVLEEYSLYS